MKDSLKVVLSASVLIGYPYASDEIKSAYKSDDVSLDSSISSLINPNNTPITNELLYSGIEYQAFENRDDEHAFINDLDSISEWDDPSLDYLEELNDDDVELIPIL